ncbi:hypothetical protein HY994_02650 [Candidatus Micrarchaeota archaeon]|nr:hypothetical protein [Candidatus Micrarchaeota archaeon]
MSRQTLAKLIATLFIGIIIAGCIASTPPTNSGQTIAPTTTTPIATAQNAKPNLPPTASPAATAKPTTPTKDNRTNNTAELATNVTIPVTRTKPDMPTWAKTIETRIHPLVRNTVRMIQADQTIWTEFDDEGEQKQELNLRPTMTHWIPSDNLEAIIGYNGTTNFAQIDHWASPTMRNFIFINSNYYLYHAIAKCYNQTYEAEYSFLDMQGNVTTKQFFYEVPKRFMATLMDACPQ